MLCFHDQGGKKPSFAVLSELQDRYWACFSPKESLLSASQHIQCENIKDLVPKRCELWCWMIKWMKEIRLRCDELRRAQWPINSENMRRLLGELIVVPTEHHLCSAHGWQPTEL